MSLGNQRHLFHYFMEIAIHKDIRRALLDQAKDPSSPASCISRGPHKMPLGAHETTRYLSPDTLPLYLGTCLCLIGWM